MLGARQASAATWPASLPAFAMRIEFWFSIQRSCCHTHRKKSELGGSPSYSHCPIFVTRTPEFQSLVTSEHSAPLRPSASIIPITFQNRPHSRAQTLAQPPPLSVHAKNRSLWPFRSLRFPLRGGTQIPPSPQLLQTTRVRAW
jgi:hypothetical protein